MTDLYEWFVTRKDIEKRSVGQQSCESLIISAEYLITVGATFTLFQDHYFEASWEVHTFRITGECELSQLLTRWLASNRNDYCQYYHWQWLKLLISSSPRASSNSSEVASSWTKSLVMDDRDRLTIDLSTDLVLQSVRELRNCGGVESRYSVWIRFNNL